MSYLFPDLIGDRSSTTVSSSSLYPEEILPYLELKEDVYQAYKLLMARIKSSPLHGIVWRLSIVLNNVFCGVGGLKGAAHLLHSFMSEIRTRWETGHIIPGVAPGPPDHSYCLFHQKLQMINCCILKRRDFEGQIVGDGVQLVELDEEEEEEDEFFDCAEDEESDRTLPVWNRKPEGRQKRLDKEKLLEYDDFLYIPVCQDPAPMTEDQLAEKAAVMFQLGFDEEGSNLRAKMQSASLLSDMEAFKAANPGSVLGDFIRWHSPRDWYSETNDISPRMKNAGNIWIQNWEIAKPVPVKRQKRLFDYTIEADKALNYLSSLNPGEIAAELLPNLIHAGIVRCISEEYVESVPHVQDILNEAIQKLAKASRLQCPAEVQHFQSINDFETRNMFEKKKFIVAKFITKDSKDSIESFQNLAESLYNSSQAEIDIDGGSMGPCGLLIQTMFEDGQRAELMNFDQNSKVNKFPKAYSKEFILRTNAPKPHEFSKSGPQRLTCLLKSDELKIAGAFSTHLAYS
ncbi:RAB3GAP1 [Lepeophtheirus salmonis]|uniref:Rab3 GTPase-activating protein catalytic subunit n=1 Tax=Lepeophtheirus salmonis TaxID=72036 RepID=A0A7R8CYF9_LEPSM|nr:RAB3GAP1 [Lepeophtheirus salmonis]CAF2968931.1 RAB3GAP1 [Lepeophtheirus salmonis]